MRQKADLVKERDALHVECNRNRDKLTAADEHIIDLENKSAQAVQTISDLKHEMQTRQNEIAKEQRYKQKLEKDLKQALTELEAKQLETKTLANVLSKKKEEHAEVVSQVKETKASSERALKENRVLESRVVKMQQELKTQSNTNEQLTAECHKTSTELKSAQAQISTKKQELSRNNKMRETIQRKLQSSEQTRLDIEQKRDAFKNKALALEKDRDVAIKMHETDKKQVDELAREREILNKNLLKAAAATTKQLDAVRLHEQNKKNLEHEIASYREESAKQRKIIFQLEKEREKYINE